MGKKRKKKTKKKKTVKVRDPYALHAKMKTGQGTHKDKRERIRKRDERRDEKNDSQ